MAYLINEQSGLFVRVCVSNFSHSFKDFLMKMATHDP